MKLKKSYILLSILITLFLISIFIVKNQSDESVKVALFFPRYTPKDGERLEKVYRKVKLKSIETTAIANELLILLLNGPNKEEKEKGYFNYFIPGTSVLNIYKKEKVLFINFNENFAEQKRYDFLIRSGQIIETFQSNKKLIGDIEEVKFLVNGQQLVGVDLMK
ncbi:GerMN domain-containing protein [Carboxydothermus pertinax]|uniref:GerMN domain-containing protein n=1 Tax=Carboxydothermus pertinax TaxID=870242 RepID=A0A1L8CYQ5_9THEO|nr:GerMN domain-containing protein [Carboxydothermus pertinax]GAV24048.1 hypothetical protein cpu_25580 [Carboxydothermus pertinax]